MFTEAMLTLILGEKVKKKLKFYYYYPIIMADTQIPWI